jgi:hypothetical protein
MRFRSAKFVVIPVFWGLRFAIVVVHVDVVGYHVHVVHLLAYATPL